MNRRDRRRRTSASDDHATAWGGAFARFEDIDQNSFALVSFDEVSRAVEAQRQAAAERREAERRAAHELEIARQVQARLFPQRLPELESLEYAGACVQTHQVGGDYYDFLDLGQARLCLVLGDIAGKGIAAALLMANLQANLRSQCATAVEQPEQLLRSVNRLFYENTAENAYATLFYSEFDDRTCRLRYANCGHLPGLSSRATGRSRVCRRRPRCSDCSRNGPAAPRSFNCAQAICSPSTPTASPRRSTNVTRSSARSDCSTL